MMDHWRCIIAENGPEIGKVIAALISDTLAALIY